MVEEVEVRVMVEVVVRVIEEAEARRKLKIGR